jgi:hypothetical protein
MTSCGDVVKSLLQDRTPQRTERPESALAGGFFVDRVQRQAEFYELLAVCQLSSSAGSSSTSSSVWS